MHNRFIPKAKTNYYNFYLMVDLVNGEYVLKEKPLKEKKLNEIKLNEMKLNEKSLDTICLVVNNQDNVHTREIENEQQNKTTITEDDEWKKMINDLDNKEEEE